MLPAFFWTVPKFATTTMTRADLKKTLLQSDGWIQACGYIFWDIKSKHLGAGVYRVSLKRRP